MGVTHRRDLTSPTQQFFAFSTMCLFWTAGPRKQVVGGEPLDSSSIPGSLRLRGGVVTVPMKASRSKRCRENRPLTGVGRLAERERPADCSGSSMQDQVALGARRSPTPVFRSFVFLRYYDSFLHSNKTI